MQTFLGWLQDITEVAELIKDRDLSFDEQPNGTVGVKHPEARNGGYFLVFYARQGYQDMKTFEVGFPGDHNAHDEGFWGSMGRNIPKIAKLAAASVARFLQQYQPGELELERLFQVFQEFQVQLGVRNNHQGKVTERGQLTADALVRWSVAQANRTAEDPNRQYAQIGTKIIRKDLNRRRSREGSDNYVHYARQGMDRHQNQMAQNRDAAYDRRQGIVKRTQAADDLFNQSRTPNRRRTETPDSYAARVWRKGT